METLCLLVLGLLPCFALPGVASEPPAVVEFNRDIRPILSENCFACHGPDPRSRKGRLRLDRPDGLFGDRHILVAGKPQESELFARVIETNPSERMPPARTNKSLTAEQIELLRRWIEQGAKYQGHWAFLPPRRANPPTVKNKAWPRNAIDNFVLTRLESARLAPAPPADPRTLIRRLSFDVLGLPPTPAEVEAFSADPSPQAYEKLVDRMLASPHFGERMAIYWLDLVRYADSEGYLLDHPREVSLYRDWVIDAFNHNMPFDEFTIAQLAGDLLPQPTTRQKVASGYNRILQTAAENGVNFKEYQAKFHADRVRNLSTVWLGLTMACCECHDHKNDPITTKEFYQMEAFFADIQDFDVPSPTGIDRNMQELENVKKEIVVRQDKHDTQEKKSLKKIWVIAGSVVVMPFAWAVAMFGALVQFVSPLLMSVGIGTLNDQTDQLKDRIEQQIELRKVLAEQEKVLEKTCPKKLVTQTGPPGTIRILPRGNWQSDSGEIVEPGTPAVLPALGASAARPNRLDLARWLMKPENPLPARVFVNRLWMLLLGDGLVRTPEDFGAQGAVPINPDLLDWLAVEFQQSGWDTKHVIRLILLSQTYRQASTPAAADELKQADSARQFFGRQARFRLQAEMIRDNALSVSGLLSTQIGGPSVKPYQPATYWENTVGTWQDDSAPQQYRRGLYTFWRRTSLHPSLRVFDAPSREECTVQRPQSNTPQQALLLLNDPSYVEAARVFAQRVIRAGGKSTQERIQYAVREALQRPARAEELKVLHDLAELHLAQYRADPEAARAVVAVGKSAPPDDVDPCELAAWTSVAQVILNLHESITRY